MAFFFDIGRLLFSQNRSVKCSSHFCGCVFFFFTTLVVLLIIEKDNNTTTLASYKTRYIILLSKDQEDQEEDQEDQEDGEPGSGGDAERAAGEERERGAFARGGVGVDCDF